MGYFVCFVLFLIFSGIWGPDLSNELPLEHCNLEIGVELCGALHLVDLAGTGTGQIRAQLSLKTRKHVKSIKQEQTEIRVRWSPIGPHIFQKSTLDIVLASGGSKNILILPPWATKEVTHLMLDIFDVKQSVMLPMFCSSAPMYTKILF